jgi:hypothetical protein
MIGFFVKKALYDGWDSLLSILALNLLFLAVAFGGFFLVDTLVRVPPVAVAAGILAVSALGVFALGLSLSFARVAAFKSFSWKDVPRDLLAAIPHGIALALSACVLAAVFSVALPYYHAIGGRVGFALFALMVWIALIVLLSLQWFLPIRSQLDRRFLKCVKKSFVIFFDNPGLSLFLFGYSIALGVLSLASFFMIPGVFGVVLAQNEAFRLLMHKYDWIEKHPELEYRVARKSVPWAELIADERETLGDRSFRHFIFPWKD